MSSEPAPNSLRARPAPEVMNGAVATHVGEVVVPDEPYSNMQFSFDFPISGLPYKQSSGKFNVEGKGVDKATMSLSIKHVHNDAQLGDAINLYAYLKFDDLEFYEGWHSVLPSGKKVDRVIRVVDVITPSGEQGTLNLSTYHRLPCDVLQFRSDRVAEVLPPGCTVRVIFYVRFKETNSTVHWIAGPNGVVEEAAAE